MRALIITLLLTLIFINGFAQNPRYEYLGRLTPSVKKEKLGEANFITDISPDLWGKMSLPQKDREALDQRRRMYYPLGYYLYPRGGYNIVIDYVSVEISAIGNGVVLTSKSTSDKLTPEQKNILNTADPGSDITIKINFKYKFRTNDNADISKIVNGISVVTVVPETEAEYPGGNKQITAYLMENVINKISETGTSEKLRQAIVKFTVNEEGQIVNAKIFRTSGTSQTDKILLDAINKMPKWKPAKNAKGIKIKQEFNIPFGRADDC